MGIGALERESADASCAAARLGSMPAAGEPRSASRCQHQGTMPTHWALSCSRGGCMAAGVLTENACNQWVQGAEVQQRGRVGLLHAGSQVEQADQAGRRLGMPHRGLGG